MFNLFSRLEIALINLLSDFVTHPVSVLATGIGIFAASVVTVWMMYRTFLVLAGMEPEPLFPIIKNFLIKVTIIAVASSTGFVSTYFVNSLQGIQDGLAADLGGHGETSVFLTIEKNITEIIIAMESLGAGGTPSESDYEMFKNSGEDVPAWVMGMAWIKDKLTAAKDAVINAFDVFSMFMQFVYIAIVAIGLVFLGIMSFFTIMTNKFFFVVCLSVAPLFIFFSAFSFSRGWFSSWLNTTLGYGFAYPMVLLTIKGLFSVFNQIFNFGSLSFAAALWCCLICFIFSFLIARIGDIASALFSANNISDGTNLLLAGVGIKSSKGLYRANNYLRSNRSPDPPSIEEGK